MSLLLVLACLASDAALAAPGNVLSLKPTNAPSLPPGVSAAWTYDDAGQLIVEITNRSAASVVVDWDASVFQDGEGPAIPLVPGCERGDGAHVSHRPLVVPPGASNSETVRRADRLDGCGEILNPNDRDHRIVVDLAVTAGGRALRLRQSFLVVADPAALEEWADAQKAIFDRMIAGQELRAAEMKASRAEAEALQRDREAKERAEEAIARAKAEERGRQRVDAARRYTSLVAQEGGLCLIGQGASQICGYPGSTVAIEHTLSEAGCHALMGRMQDALADWTKAMYGRTAAMGGPMLGRIAAIGKGEKEAETAAAIYAECVASFQ